MSRQRVGRYPKAFREMAVERLRGSENISALAKELGIHRRLLYKWRDDLDLVEDGKAPPANLRERELRKEVGQLKRQLGNKMLELDFFKGALQKVEARRRKSEGSGEKASTTKSEK